MPTNNILGDSRDAAFIKDPRARLDIVFDWSAWLAAEGTSIASSSWSMDPDTNTMTLDGATLVGATCKVYVSGGTHQCVCLVRNTITTANGLIDSRSIKVVCQDR